MPSWWVGLLIFHILGMLVRLKITLKAAEGNLISFNYHYHLSAAVYNLLHFGSVEFAKFLHDVGFNLNGKTYKLFTFALRFEKYTNLQNAIRLDDSKAYLYISSARVEDFIKSFVIGTFEKQIIDLSELNFPVKFKINFVETVPDPQFTDEMNFRMMTPMVLSTRREHNGKTSQYFLRAEDKEDINRVLTQNLQNKYEAISGERKVNGKVELEWDENYLRRVKRITKKITIDQNGKFPIDVIGLNAPFTLKGHPELIRVGYECGFGEKNSMGFGMTEVK